MIVAVGNPLGLGGTRTGASSPRSGGTHGSVTWGWLGVSLQDVSPAIAQGLGLKGGLLNISLTVLMGSGLTGCARVPE